MKISLNGDEHDVPAGTTAARLLESLELTGKRVAVEINKDIVPRGRLDGLTIQPGDRVEIVHAIGGG